MELQIRSAVFPIIKYQQNEEEITYLYTILPCYQQKTVSKPDFGVETGTLFVMSDRAITSLNS